MLKLIHDHFAPGDQLVETRGATGDILAQAFVTPKGRALLVVNKRNAKTTVRLREAWKDAEVSVVDSSAPPHTAAWDGPRWNWGLSRWRWFTGSERPK